jgi:hypothetical protein
LRNGGNFFDGTPDNAVGHRTKRVLLGVRDGCKRLGLRPFRLIESSGGVLIPLQSAGCP